MGRWAIARHLSAADERFGCGLARVWTAPSSPGADEQQAQRERDLALVHPHRLPPGADRAVRGALYPELAPLLARPCHFVIYHESLRTLPAREDWDNGHC